MRVVVISSCVFKVPLHQYGGLEQIAWECARGLAALGHQVALFAPDGSRGHGFDIVPFGPPGNWDEHAAFDKYWKHLMHFDAVIDHSWQKWSYGLKAEGVLKAPVIGVWHAPINTMKTLPPGVEKPCAVLISDDQRAHFEGLFGRPGRTCYNGVDLSYYTPLDAARSDRALFLARFSAIKGADLAIAACKEAGVPLDLVGDISITNEPDFFHHCRRHCDGSHIRMVGPESRGGCVHRFSKANFFVHPNQRFREPFGLAPVEAMACGLPCVAWNAGAMRETVKHGETGYLVENQQQLVEAIKALAQPGAITDATRKRCREWVAERFSVEKMALRYQELIQEAIGGGW